MKKEALARIKINKLLETAGWRFFADGKHPPNIQLEPSVTLKHADLDELGEDFQNAKKGYIDFLLLNEKGHPFIVLEAKSEDKDPLDGKEQARKYARSQNCRFVILSNGNLHYFWDLERGNPYVISIFPSPSSVIGYERVVPDARRLISEPVARDYITLTQLPRYADAAAWKNEGEREAFIAHNKLRFLREYQVRALHAVQKAVSEGKDRFLFTMATGTGKTLLAAAVIRLFLRTANASRVLFLVDRLELEEQAWKNFADYLKNDFRTVIYKENRDEWRSAEIVVSTVQSFQFNNRYMKAFSPTDFDLVISDEAHRSIGGNARAVFDYFVGYKLGLTATPRDYLKNFHNAEADDPREQERRVMLDTYRTFGCESGIPTFSYSLDDGVRDGFLISPTVVDARTDVTTRLLADQGLKVTITDDQGGEQELSFQQRQFEKRFFSKHTNALFCRTFLEHALRDPVSGEIGKSIVFAVSQKHASKLTQILNVMADELFPGRYQSDFAVQVTSRIPDAQQFTVNFANNRLLGSGNFIDTYRTSKARVCVTVGMMTTGYDCPDLLNVVLMRPIFSPTDFIQIKGRGTRKHDFREQVAGDPALLDSITQPQKSVFKLFDFFANCEYFEERFDYDQVLALPKPPSDDTDDGGDVTPPPPKPGEYNYGRTDSLESLKVHNPGPMKVDRMFFQKFEETIKHDSTIAQAIEARDWDRIVDYVNRELFEKPDDFFTLEKLRRASAVDRRITIREIVEKALGLIPGFKTRDEILEEEFAKFLADKRPATVEAIPAIKTFFKAYATSDQLRHIIDAKEFTQLHTNPGFTFGDFKAVPHDFRLIVPEYIKDYVPLNQFA